MYELNPVEMKRELTEVLVQSGVPEEEAKQQASQQIDAMGAAKTAAGQCPLGRANVMACMFCSFGHMTCCHYPQTCEEAKCSHYQQQIAAEGPG